MADSTIDEIKRRLDVVDVIGQTVALKRSGKGFKGLCPFHGEKTPSFYVSPERGSWHCFGCGEGGDVFTFVQKRDNLGFAEALQVLADRAGVVIEPRAKPDPGAREARDRLHGILESAALYFRGVLTSETGATARAYFHDRGVTPESIERFGLGYSDPQGRGLERHLIRAGYSVEECVQAGALGQSEDGTRVYDRFRDRVIFPIRDAEGRAIGFGGRILRSDQQPKYLNSPQSDMFDKGSNLYLLDLARDAVRKASQAIVVEGYMDALIAHQAGFANVVATLGTALTERHVQVLRRQGLREIVLSLDADAAGLRAASRGSAVAHDSTSDEAPRIDFGLLGRAERPRGRGSMPTMYVERRTILKVMTLHGGKDPDEVIRHDPSEWTRAVEAARPVIDFVLENLPRVFDLSTTDGRREAAMRAVDLIYDVADPIDRDRHLQRLAAIIGTGLDVLRELVRRKMRIVQPAGSEEDGPPPAPPAPAPAYEERLEDLAIALLLRARGAGEWPAPNDFESAAHRAILERLADGPDWPDAPTAFDRLAQELGEPFVETLERIKRSDGENERLAQDDVVHELQVRRLELRKLRLFRQHQALDSALREEAGGLSVAEQREYHERLARLAGHLGRIFEEQRRLGVVGTASWSIRRGQEVLGG
ncbi:MAG: DNA primase [Chloroflexi bacterium]|nr:DNA primase [Chloroflexota bacterium]